MTAPLLPAPMAWLRQSGWGRDVTSWAREEDRPFVDDEVVWASTPDDEEPLRAIVNLARMRRVIGSIGPAMIDAMTTKTTEEAAELYYGTAHEHMVAASIATWIESGEKISSFGPELSKSFIDGEGDVDPRTLLGDNDARYIRFEQIDVPSVDGRPLDGFMIVCISMEGEKIVEIVPFSRSPIEIGAPNTILGNFEIREDSEQSLTAMMLRMADEGEAAMPVLREGVAKRREEAATYTQRRHAIIGGLTPGADHARTVEADLCMEHIERIRSHASTWTRLIAGAMRTISTQEPQGLPAYPTEAPADLAKAAVSNGRNAPRAIKKLRSEGWPRMSRHEIGIGAEIPGGDPAEMPAEPVAGDNPPATVETTANRRERTSRRRERRLERINAQNKARAASLSDQNEMWRRQAAEGNAVDHEPAGPAAKVDVDGRTCPDESLTDQSPPLPEIVQTSPVTHDSWETMTSPCAPLGQKALARLQYVLSGNTVARAAFRSLKDGKLAGEACHAVTRQLASLADADESSLDTLSSPQIEGDADLNALSDRDGVLVVADRALFEYASPGRIGPIEPMRETALCVFYRIRRSGMDALIMQVDGNSRLNLLQWMRMPLSSTEDDADLAWYLRGAVALVSNGIESEDQSAAVLPARTATARRIEFGEPPRRTVAQVRLRPADLSVAQRVATRWFDDQVARHGDMLVEHRREDGEWMIEHRSVLGSSESRWSVTLRVCRDDPSMLDIILRTTTMSGVKPRLPGLVREIAEATPTEALDGILETNPPVARDRSDVMELVRELQDPDRDLPILLMTSDVEGKWLTDPITIARQALGAVTVRLLQAGSTFDLTDALGQEYRTFGGAVRLFQPRFDPDNDLAARHPRIMPGPGADRALAEMISRATGMTVTRYPIPESDPAPVKPTPSPLPSVAPTTAHDHPPKPAAQAAAPVTQVAPERAFLPSTVRDVDGIGRTAATGDDETKADAPPEAVQDAAEVVPDRTAGPDMELVARLVEEEVSRRMAVRADKETQVDRPLPLDLPPAPPPPSVPPAIATDEAALDERIAKSVSAAYASTGIPELVAAIGKLVGRMDSGLTAPVQQQVVSYTPDAALEIARREETIAALREELRSEREAADNLLSEAEAGKTAAEDEVATLRAALNHQRRLMENQSDENEPVGYPQELSGLADWLKSNVLPNVVVTTKAWRTMRKVRYVDMERLCKTLCLLNGPYADMRAGIEGARARWLDGLKELRLDNKKQSEGGKSIRGGAEYRFTHEGYTWEMDWHLRGLESIHNDHERLLRIYYAFDEKSGRVLIGHMPTHLQTVDS